MSGDGEMKKGAKGAQPTWHACAKTALNMKLIDKDGWKRLVEAFEKGMAEHYAAIDAELKEAKKADAPKKAKAATVAELQKQMKEMQAKIDAVAK